jgi:adenylate cyclase
MAKRTDNSRAIDSPAATRAGEYELRYLPSPKRVRVEFNGTWIADTTRAIVLHETRQPPAHYIPKEDVRMDLLRPTAFHTHCPFKGDASYWTLQVGDARSENAAWSYEEPYRGAEAIKGHLSFYRSRIAALYEGDDEVPFLAAQASGLHANPLAGWLLQDAWKAASAAELAQQFLRFLRAMGCPVDRGTVIIPTLHPQIFATVLVWRADTPEIRVVYEPHDILHQPRFADSPFAPIIRGAGGVRRRLEEADVKLDFPVVRELRAEGATDYVAMPFRFSDGQINVVSMTSFARGGFAVAHLGQIYEVMPMLARLFEVHALRRTAAALLETYLGHDTGRRVLNGLVKRGDGEDIDAVIWFCDFRDSTVLSGSLPREAYLEMLNRFFYCMAGAVLKKGGEVLKYIGDAVLAIFPTAGGVEDACRRALQAAALAAERVAAANAAHPEAPPMRFGIGLHVGTVTYGNIGVPQRLDFTVIGTAANEAARIESLTRELNHMLLASAAFAAQLPGKLVPAGRHRLKGLDGEYELFTITPAAAAAAGAKQA